jgi:hypothetical protein
MPLLHASEVLSKAMKPPHVAPLSVVVPHIGQAGPQTCEAQLVPEQIQ